MGEKFAVNPVTGTGSISIPLPASTGRGGFTPGLSLSYDSGSGNGPFGLGWKLSAPAVTRKTDKGLPRYMDTQESDVFLLSGAEDLVPLLDANGSRISFHRTLHKIEYKVHLYRPRIEGSFARIERWCNTATGVNHWRTITRDNVTTLFGFDPGSIIVDPRDATRVFSYLICRSFDDKGNIAIYEYASEDSADIDLTTAHEAGRGAADRNAQSYLKSIRYGNAQPYFPDWSETGGETPLPNQWHFQIVCDYGDHRADDPAPVRDQAWPVRPDPFSVYRPGFELRTYRRCRRILFFHSFPNEPGVGADCLVRSLDLLYSDDVSSSDPSNPIYTMLESVTSAGYKRSSAGYDRRSSPPLEFFYSRPQLQAEVLTLDDSDSRENFPEGLDGSRFRWVDLNAEGLSGILAEQNGEWLYKRNLSPIHEVLLPNGGRAARARFAPLETVASLPVPASLNGGQQLLDLTGAGRLDLVAFDGPAPGYFARTAAEGWECLKTFSSLPRLNWSEPNLQFVDLTGDGRADVLITEDDVFTFYASLGAEGFAEAERVYTPEDEARGPRVVLADGTQTVSLADMTGDGLRDLVRVRNGEICYWPNLGYGRFGAKVAMDGAPRLVGEDQFDPRRVRLSDVDGSGTADLLYVGENGVLVCYNQSGNSFSAPNQLAIFPGADTLSSVQAMDLLGNGTSCLVWSSPLPGQAHAPLRYVDLMGSQKPHLLIRMRNNLGAETRVSYAPSTRFYLEDQLAGRPWITRLPFPVQTVERVETFDFIGRSRFATRRAYHHGYFDGEEREFRGFGMVEQWDTEEHRSDTLFPDLETANQDALSYCPPMLTRTWFHTGAFAEAGAVSRQYAGEYWVEPALRGDTPVLASARAAQSLGDSVLDPGLTPEEMREAYRALKGSALRTETYAQDGTPQSANPYSVTENNYTVQRVQGFGPNQHAVFRTHGRESLTYEYERNASDPRVSHNLTLEIGDFGLVLRSASVAYGRRPGYPDPEPNLSGAFRQMLAYDQGRLHVRATENRYTSPVNHPEDALPIDSYHAPMPSETIVAELTGLAPSASRFDFQVLDGHFKTLWSGSQDVPYESVPAPDIDGVSIALSPARRIVGRMRTLYRSDDLSAILPLDGLDSMALPGQVYQLALTAGLLTRIFADRLPDSAALVEGGYVQLPGDSGWWIPSEQVFYSPGDHDSSAAELAQARAHFFQPRRVVDPFGAITRSDFDPYDLLQIASTDAAGNVTAAEYDYRVLQAWRVTDPNANRTEAAFDTLGLVVGSALRGKASESLGDLLDGFAADLDDAVVAAHLADPLSSPDAILGNASSRIVYDRFAYYRTRGDAQPAPPAVYTLARETHVSDLAPGQVTLYQHGFAYCDGFGRQIQKKVQAEPDAAAPRWAASGWTIYNNKGNPVRTYEPFFSNTQAFEFAQQTGVSSVLFYDAPGRVVATLHPNKTWQKTVFENWRQQKWDLNDTVLISDPRTDPDVGSHFIRFLGSGANAFISWYDRRISGAFGGTPEEQAAEKEAAQKTAPHAATPEVSHLDSLGRACLTVADNGAAGRYPARSALDTENRQLAVFDALGRRAAEYCLREPGSGSFVYVAGYDMTGQVLYHNGMDTGERRMLPNIAGHSIRIWDALPRVFRLEYDKLRRPTHRWVSSAGADEILLTLSIYGEGLAAQNLCGRIFRQYDGAGVAIHENHDFKGNLTGASRQFTDTYRQAVNWRALADLISAADLDQASAALLNQAERYSSLTRYDALNRPIQTVTPHRASMRPNVLRAGFNRANQLVAVDVWKQQAAVPSGLLDPATADLHAVTGANYNARGQRVGLALGNGTTTSFDYDAETFRMTHLSTARPGSFGAGLTLVQNLTYFYDPAGNVTRVRDTADTQNIIYFQNQRVEPSSGYTYDAIYRLTAATGREHLGQQGGALASPQQTGNSDGIRMGLPQPGDGNAMGIYKEAYTHDAAGNILAILHQAASGAWTRRYSYAEASRITAAETGNRLSATSLPSDPAGGPFTDAYFYDAHGSMVRMPHLPALAWDEEDRLRSTTRQVSNAGTPETTFYVYDANSQRQRKTTDRQSADAQSGVRKTERLYLGGLEIYREYDNDGVTVTLERETLDVVAGPQRIAAIETRTAGKDPAPAQLVRYQYTNHLGSATLELDGQAGIISYEEYFPYGSTAYQAVRSQTETPKRYRCNAKERDEENDLYYYGARYYAPWLGRWTSADPAGLSGGVNLYRYVSCNPASKIDPDGKDDSPVTDILKRPTAAESLQLYLASQYSFKGPRASAPAWTLDPRTAKERKEQPVPQSAEQMGHDGQKKADERKVINSGEKPLPLAPLLYLRIVLAMGSKTDVKLREFSPPNAQSDARSGPQKLSFDNNPNSDIGGFIGKVIPDLGLKSSDLIGFVLYTVPTGLAGGLIKPQGLFGIFKDVSIRPGDKSGPLELRIDSFPVAAPIQGNYWGGAVRFGVGGALLATGDFSFHSDSSFNTASAKYQEATKDSMVEHAREKGHFLDKTKLKPEEIPNVWGTIFVAPWAGFVLPTSSSSAPHVQSSGVDASGAPSPTLTQVPLVKPGGAFGLSLSGTF